jgi:hypothetical protein
LMRRSKIVIQAVSLGPVRQYHQVLMQTSWAASMRPGRSGVAASRRQHRPQQ